MRVGPVALAASRSASARRGQEGGWLGQTILLSEKRDMEDIATAIRKVRRSAEALKA